MARNRNRNTGKTPASTKTPAAKAATTTASKEPTVCRCGCGKTVGKRSKFAQGHDARVYGQVLRGERPESDLADSPLLQSKLAYARQQAEAKATRQAEAKAAKAAEVEATPDASEDTDSEPTPKVRRRPSRVTTPAA